MVQLAIHGISTIHRVVQVGDRLQLYQRESYRLLVLMMAEALFGFRLPTAGCSGLSQHVAVHQSAQIMDEHGRELPRSMF